MPKVSKVCEVCGKEFITLTSVLAKGHGKTCSWNCRLHGKLEKKTCQECGKNFFVRKSVSDKGHGKFCSVFCRGRAKRGNKACGYYDGYTVYLGEDGYLRVLLPGHKNKFLHVYIAEKAVGRSLEGHVVHHIDGNIRNNANDNLVILENSQEHWALHRRYRQMLKSQGRDWRAERVR